MNNHDFNPEVQPLEEIFGKSEYHIPNYQRPYSWKKAQVEQLWYDLVDSYNNSAENDNDDESYFLGSIVLVKKYKKNNKLFYDVVDGQQRLTTLTILFCTLRDLNLDLPDWLDKRVRECIIDSSRGEQENKLILSPKENDKGYFSQKIQKNIDFTDNKYKNENQFIENAFLLKDLIENSIKSEDSEYHVDNISGFIEFLLEKVVLIKITCSNLNFAIRLFSIINDRGLNLTSTDIIKAKLFERISNNENDMAIFSREWDRIEDICKDTNESINNLFDIYFHYLTGGKAQSALNNEFDKLLNQKASKQDEGDEFKKETLSSKSSLDIIFEIQDLLREITEINQTKDDIEICMLKYLEQSTYWKSVLATAKKVNYIDFDTLKKLLVKYYYQSLIADGTANRVKQTSFKVLRAVKKHESIDKVKEIILENLAKYNNYNTYLNGNKVYHKTSWIKPILLLLEYNNRDSVNFIELSRDLHIEHILPQEWKNKNLNWSTYFTQEESDKWLNSLGNLTLLKGSKNIQASNNNFLYKKDIYLGKYDNKVSSFELTRKLALIDEWTPETIESRQNKMIKIIQSILDIN